MKKARKKSSKKTLINLCVYGIFDTKVKKITKVSLDPSEIQMELAFSGGQEDSFVECQFDIKLIL